jgi:hypothetical protein
MKQSYHFQAEMLPKLPVMQLPRQQLPTPDRLPTFTLFSRRSSTTLIPLSFKVQSAGPY